MSTYVISDIHGQLKQFKELLKAINFHYDYTDELYILGDFCDWGDNPIDTILYIIDLCNKYSFIHCCIGNHDLWLKQCIEENWTEEDVYYSAWISNDGLSTYYDLKDRSQSDKIKILKFLDGLPLEIPNVKVNGRLYHFAHAHPAVGHSYEEKVETAVWERIGWNERPRGLESEYHIFIHGHTITKHFLSRHRNIKAYIIPCADKSVINIDCGAKAATSYKEYRLAILDISNMQVYYSDELKPKPIWLPDGIMRH